MNTRAARGRILGPLALALLLAACAAPSRSVAPSSGGQPAVMEPTQFSIGTSAITASFANLQTAKDAGIFLKHGLDPELRYTGGGANSIASLLSGEVPIQAGGVSAFVIAQLGGADLAVIGVQNNRFDYVFVAVPEIRQPEDLRGKAVAGTRQGASADIAIGLLLRYWGLEPGRDVRISEINAGESARAAALANGAVVGTVVNPPLPPELAGGNYTTLADMSKLDIDFASTGFAAPRNRLAQDPDFYERFLRAYVEGNHYYRTHPEEGTRGLMTYLKRDDVEWSRAAYDYFSAMLPRSPTPKLSALQAVLDTMVDENPRARTTRPEDLLDLAALQKVEASGFVQQVWGN